MASVGIRELKANLSHYLKTAQRGEEIEVLSRGRVVARITGAISRSHRTTEDALAELASEGLVELPSEAKRKAAIRPIRARGSTPTSRIVKLQRR